MVEVDNFRYAWRQAVKADIPVLKGIMEASILQLMNEFLTPNQVRASFEVMGLDTQLIEDGTYYAILEGDEIIGCGGWSARQTLYGGDQTKGRDARMLNPETDAARIRAMYTHPNYKRRGVGRMTLALCEAKAHAKGFACFELMATLAGKELYQVCGYENVEEETVKTSAGILVPLVKMRKWA
ncbi:GNAT family N-acetyltransferase [Kordiimonas pumila]|uniref:GNAT family N-acetyltransferase n=1 Tax=Kordiimonas pumila TaxID=2161677 RepID=A0ABV7D7H5_9PROT|nr:GNAT family N-acetyltransferase [Kordiimonas pumila]